MIAKLKESPNGGFYCSECRMSTPDPVDTCPFCGSMITNWEEIARVHSTMDLENPDTFYLNEFGGNDESNIS